MVVYAIASELDTISNLVTTLGFPIVACGALFWFVNKQEKRHSEEMEGMRNALNENTSILASLKELIEMILGRDKV